MHSSLSHLLHSINFLSYYFSALCCVLKEKEGEKKRLHCVSIRETGPVLCTSPPTGGYPLTFSPLIHACLNAPAASERGCPLKSKDIKREVMSLRSSGHLYVFPSDVLCCLLAVRTAWIALLRKCSPVWICVLFNGSSGLVGPASASAPHGGESFFT